jgi:hypothetical protein
MEGLRQRGVRHSAGILSPAGEPPIPPVADIPRAGASRRAVWQRMLRVLRLDRSVFAEVERDPAGTRQATKVVAFVAAAAALGTALLGAWHPGAILGAALAALLHWLLWSGLEALAAGVLFRRPMSLERHLRALGYAQTPQLLALFAFVPTVGPWVVLGSRLLTLLAGNQALGAVFELHRRQALAIRLVSFGIAVVATAGVRALLGEVPFLTALLRP